MLRKPTGSISDKDFNWCFWEVIFWRKNLKDSVEAQNVLLVIFSIDSIWKMVNVTVKSPREFLAMAILFNIGEF